MNRLFLSTFLIILSLQTGCSQKPELQVGVTTTLEDSGILAELINAFEQDHQLTIKPIIAASGQIHQLIKRGDIDTAITHDPAGEQQLLKEQVIQKRIPLMHNDFLIIGPKGDPAHGKLAITPDEVLQKINFVEALFISRNDSSGTHQMEHKWWDKVLTPINEEFIVKTGTGMGATLSVAAERLAYTLVDRGTWLNFSNKQDLVVIFEDAELLPNHYSILSFGDNKSDEWESWLQGDSAKNIIRNYRIDNQAVFSIGVSK